jgi:hypothetical protein
MWARDFALIGKKSPREGGSGLQIAAFQRLAPPPPISRHRKKSGLLTRRRRDWTPNRIDGRTTIARELFRYEGFGEKVSPPIHMRTAFAKAFDTG